MSLTAGAGERSDTLRSLLLNTVQAYPERPAITYRCRPAAEKLGRRQRCGDWNTLTWHEFAHVLLGVIDRLDRLVGRAGTVAILAETDARYPVLELALGLTGRVTQPLYVTSPDPELRRAVETTGASALVVGRSQRGRAQAAGPHLPVIELDTVVPLPESPLGADAPPFDPALLRARLSRLPLRPPDDALLYLQSTGTTGPPRVIEVSEKAILASVQAVRGETTHPFPRFLSFLPTAHISERLLTLYVSLALAGHTWYGGGTSELRSDLPACCPTVLLAPPLVFEAIRGEALAAAASSALGRWLVASVGHITDQVLSEGRVHVASRGLGARAFGSLMRRQAGLAQVRDAFAGTAPVPAKLQAWWDAVGLPIRIVYGQTEVAGATSITARSGVALDSVGAPVRGVEVKIGDDDELWVRSPSAFTRYVGAEAATTRTRPQGWLRTGDRATIRANGEIVLLGRVQSLVRAPDGAVVDTDALLAQVVARLGAADVALASAAPQAGVFLYVALHPPGEPAHALREGIRLDPITTHDLRWGRFAAFASRIDQHGVVRGLAMFDGAFPLATGELGPTGKPRGWRIHQLRSDDLHELSHSADDPTSPIPR